MLFFPANLFSNHGIKGFVLPSCFSMSDCKICSSSIESKGIALALVKGPITFQNVSMNVGYLMKRKRKKYENFYI